MPWYQVAAIALSGAVAAIAVAKFFTQAFAHAVSTVMAEEIRTIHRVLDRLDETNAARFAQLDNALGNIQAQFHPNGGSSHADKLEALHRRITEMAACLESLERKHG